MNWFFRVNRVEYKVIKTVQFLKKTTFSNFIHSIQQTRNKNRRSARQRNDKNHRKNVKQASRMDKRNSGRNGISKQSHSKQLCQHHRYKT